MCTPIVWVYVAWQRPSGWAVTMTMTDSAKPKKARRRNRTYAKRVEVRLTEHQLKTLDSLSEASRARGGRALTLSEVLRAALDDGCETIADAFRSQPSMDGEESRRLASSFDGAADELCQVKTQVRRIGNSLNQMARVGNQTGSVPDGLSGTRAQLARIDERLLALSEHFIDATNP